MISDIGMIHKLKFGFVFSIFIFLSTSYCGQKPQKPYITGESEFLRVLIVFAQFGNDSAQISDWAYNRLPDWSDDFIDPDPDSKFRQFTLSDYWFTMSAGGFKLVGEVYDELVLLKPESNYKEAGGSFGDVNLEVLRRIDENIDWSLYDNWSYNKTEKKSEFKSDGIVDMVYIIYRNAGVWFGSFTAIAKLGFRDRYITADGIEIDGGLGYNGSGVTVRQGFRGKIDLIERCAHEYGHYLFGYFHTAIGGIMGGGTYALAGWELERLGYVNPVIPRLDGEEIALGDMLTSGDLLKIPIPFDDPDPSNYYLIENHQRISPYDQISRGGSLEGAFDFETREGSGIYVWLITNAAYAYPGVTLKAADGTYDWGITDTIRNSPLCGCDVPGFARISVNRERGRSDREVKMKFNGADWPMWYEFDGLKDEWILTRDNMGDESDAFNLNRFEIFSPWSNPSSLYGKRDSAGFQIVGERRDSIRVKVFKGGESMLSLPPSAPQLPGASQVRDTINLNWSGNREPDVISGGGYKILRSINSSDYRIAAVLRTDSLNAAGSYDRFDYSEKMVSGSAKGDTFRYKIIAFDKEGLESLPSVTAGFIRE